MEDTPEDKTTTTTGFNYQQLFEHSPIPYWIYDIETLRFLVVNRAAIELYGYTEAEFLSMTIRDIRPPEEIAPLEDAIYKGTLKKIDWRHKRKDGTIFYVQILATNIDYHGRNACAIQVIDISQRIEAEQHNTLLYNEVLRQKDQLEMINASLTDVIWVVEMGTYKRLYINAACEKMYGYTQEQVMSGEAHFFDLIHPDDKEKFFAAVNELIQQGSGQTEVRIIHKDGSIRTLLSQAHVSKSPDGQGPDVINGIDIDISELRNVQNALRDKAEEMRAMLDGITDGFYTIDDNQDFTYVNPTLERLYNKPRGYFLGKNLWDCFPLLKDSIFGKAISETIAHRVTTHAEGLAPSNGRTFSVTFYPLKNGMATYMVDVTEHRQKEQVVQHQNKTLREIAQMQSHQLRGPVATILGLAQLFNLDDHADPANKEIIAATVEATESLDEVIKQINAKTSEAGE